MSSEKLQKARDFEKEYLPFTVEEQPYYHVTGGIGWINDPNGFSVYKGEYHLFFQYYPYNTQWGPMHWGHVKTKDFVRWERLPAAMAPDMDYDKDGCFSGSAIELPDGRQMLVYTGVRNERRPDGKIEGFQTQCLAFGDGVDFEKYEANPVLDSKDVPEGGSFIDFRDPKIWKEDGVYYMVVGNRPADGSGSILLYESEDALHWKYNGIVSACHNQYGRMWECPDLFELDGKHVLLVSPQEMTAIGLEFHPGNGNVCLIGTYNYRKHHLDREQVQAIDYGLDFYAPQTLLSLDGRRIMIAWMQNWETSNCRDEKLPFFGQMTIPRELHVSEGRLIQSPVREIEAFRDFKISYNNVLVCGETTLRGINGRVLDMTINIRPGSSTEMYTRFRINVARDGEFFTSIRYKPSAGTLRVDRTHSGFPHDIVNIRDILVRYRQGELKLRILLDRYSLEIFVNDGEQAASFVIYTPLSANAISFATEGAVLMDIEKFDLKF